LMMDDEQERVQQTLLLLPQLRLLSSLPHVERK
jgi:hypothetical protein